MTSPLKITPQLHPGKRHPYYIVAPDYRRTSAGIRIMHQLCDAIRKMGYDAWILANVTHPGLNTPRLTDDVVRYHEAQEGVKPIAIYPEIIGANPLNTGLVVRYILNIPGLLGEKPNYKETDLFYAHTPEMLPAIGYPASVLNMPPTDTSIFHNIENTNDHQRSGHCIYFGRYHEGRNDYAHLLKGATEITSTFPATQEEMADLFRRSERLYCFENTAISMEARLCGCPAVILPSPFFSRKVFFGGDLGFDVGVAFSEDPEEFKRAQASLPKVSELFPSMEKNFWHQLAGMLEVTQKEASRRPRHAEVATPRQQTESPEYKTWRDVTAFNTADAQVLAERMMLKWAKKPCFHLLMPAPADCQELIQKTIDSLDRQLYGEWLLTVVTTDTVPSELATHPRVQWLAVREESAIAYVVDALLPNSPGLWLARLLPGIVFEPECLLTLADASQLHPEWRLIYSDDDQNALEGHRHSPRLKPDFNLDLLRSQDYIGPVVLIERSALLDVGTFGATPAHDHLDLILRIRDQWGDLAMGHVPELLMSLPEQAFPVETDPVALTAILKTAAATIKAHLQRNQQSGLVLDGLRPGTRQLLYNPPEETSISVVVSVQRGTEWLYPLLESLATMTPAAHEVLLTVEDAEHAQVRAAIELALIKAGWQGRGSLIATPAGASAAVAWNRAAAQARGQVMLFLDDNTHLLQHDMPLKLAALAHRRDVGIVAPRLLDPVTSQLTEGPWFSGLRGLAGAAWGPQALTEPGYMGRALCEQNVCGVNSAAWAILRQDYLDLGGADDKLHGKQHVLLDLCLRGTTTGLRHIWTPGSSLLLHKDRAPLPVDPILEQRDQELLLTRWGPQLREDPAYNTRLSLAKSFAIESSHTRPWRGQEAGKGRILGVLEGARATAQMAHWLNQINHEGRSQAGHFEHCRFDAGNPVLLFEVVRCRPDWVILDTPLNSDQQALALAIKRYFPSIKLAARLEKAAFQPSNNPLCILDAELQALLMMPLRGHIDCLFVDSAEQALLLKDVADDIEVLPIDPLMGASTIVCSEAVERCLVRRM